MNLWRTQSALEDRSLPADFWAIGVHIGGSSGVDGPFGNSVGSAGRMEDHLWIADGIFRAGFFADGTMRLQLMGKGGSSKFVGMPFRRGRPGRVWLANNQDAL